MPNKLRQAVGVVKDQTTIGLARISGAASRSSSKLDIAVVKATSHDELLPFDDRRATEVLLLLASSDSPAAAAVDLVAALRRRVSRTRSWVVVLKALTLTHHILIARAPFFASELRRRGGSSLVLDLSGDGELGEFVRAFAQFIEARFQFFTSSAADRRSPELAIERVISLQKLLDRAMGMRPTGPATSNRLVQTSLYPIVRESFEVYREVSGLLAGLLDGFLELKIQSCVETFRTCAKANKQFDELSSFYELCRKIGVGRQPEYPKMENISRSLLKRMEEFLSARQAAAAAAAAGARRASDWKEEEEGEGEEGWEAILVESVNSMTRSSRRSSLEELLKSSPWSCTNPFLHPATAPAANPFSGEVS